MATALAGRPVLAFPMPPGVTMAQWDSGTGVVTDAFKPDQVPGASQPLGGVAAGPLSIDALTPSEASKTAPGGVDSGLGGIY